MAIEIFKRREQKYLITLRQYNALIEKLSPYMRADRFGENGKYTVTTLYFESRDRKIYYETKNKLTYRQKLRLRVYNEAELNSPAFFEVKQKHKKVVNKRRLMLPLKEAYRYLHSEEEEVDGFETSNQQVLREIDYFRRLYCLNPEMIVSYDRHALHHREDADLRMTFDFNLRCRNDDLHLEHGSYGDLFIDKNLAVLEVKVNDSIPLWLTRILQELNCEQRSASKFCTSMELLDNLNLPVETALENMSLGGI